MQVEKVERKKAGGNKSGSRKNGSNKKSQKIIVTRDTQQLDGVEIDVFHQGEKIARWRYGAKAR